ncbi:HEPN domain-containing protein [Falsiroseomonas bella]|uniref:HEPN domain-containing protein n=1 Tax=Falsiroseomonas bella TaxID=2184016 RepID=UPI0038B9E9CD
MPYRVSRARRDFDSRVNGLLKTARKAERAARARPSLADVRDMAFHCAVFQACAAQEVYFKIVIESWALKLRQNGLGNSLPTHARAFIASCLFMPHYQKFFSQKDEIHLAKGIMSAHNNWPVLDGTSISLQFDGKLWHNNASYPSYSNVKKVFARLGIADFDARMGRLLKRDVELMFESFQSVRTSIAHSHPPNLTIADVESLLKLAVEIVHAIDRIFYGHVLAHGGVTCWTF